jgi:protein phosphatase
LTNKDPEVVLSAQTILDSFAVTDLGQTRASNEDSVVIVVSAENPERGTLLVLADGLGGHNAGEVASRMVTAELPACYFHRSGSNYLDDLVRSVSEVNSLVHSAGREDGERLGMCTTLVSALIVNQYLVFLNVGDSRGYLIRNQRVVHRTKDHSLTGNGSAAQKHRNRHAMSHVLMQAIGPHPTVFPDITIRKIVAGDLILLSSDGLTDVATDEEIVEIALSERVSEAAPRLVELAKKNGSTDNISVVLSQVVQVSDSSSFQIHMNDLHRYLVVDPR